MIVDLSHPIEDGIVTYPGLPGPRVGVHLGFEESQAHHAPGTEFTIGRLELVSNTGTYLDTPGHRRRDAHDLTGLSLERCADLPAVVVVEHPTGLDALPATGARSTAVPPAIAGLCAFPVRAFAVVPHGP